MDHHSITWTAPQPLWREATNRADKTRAPMAEPAILRFTTDDFMPEFLGVLAGDPQRLGEYRAVPETWRGVVNKPAPLSPKKAFALPFQRLAAARQRVNGRAPADQGRKPEGGADAGAPLKLYQPAHQRFYLVTSCLVCQLAGLPDRKVDSGKQEQAGFVMRRLLPVGADPANPPPFDEKTWKEHAWVGGPDGNSWQRVDLPEILLDSEEVVPMFGAQYAQDDQRPRRLFAGLVPVGRREAYLAAANAASLAAGGGDVTARKILLRTKVVEPWKQLLDRATKAAKAAKGVDGSADAHTPAAIQRARVELQEAAYFVLVDFAQFLSAHLRPVWDALIQTPGATEPADPHQRAATKVLQSVRLDPLSPAPAGGPLGAAWTSLIGDRQTLVATLVDAFKALNDMAVSSKVRIEDVLDGIKSAYSPETADGVAGYPKFVFPLADPEDPYDTTGRMHAALPRDLSAGSPLDATESAEVSNAKDAGEADMPGAAEMLDQLAVLLARALKTLPATAPQPAIPLAARPPADALTGWFVIRCVYRRPACGALHDDVISKRSAAFQLAGFFDPDAPARPIRIGLPVDTSPAGLRKFDKNTAFVLSDLLCGQVKRAKGMTFGDLVRAVLPFPLHKDLDPGGGACKTGAGASLGTICSLSIPIITLCAFILLIIMVSLLDLIFRWTPFFMVCFPIKGLDGKKE